MNKKLIEVNFPVKEVSINSIKERNVRFGIIANLHQWWARRPLTSSRATNYAALINENSMEIKTDQEDIIKLSRWENTLNKSLFTEMKNKILASNNNENPRILDPFTFQN